MQMDHPGIVALICIALLIWIRSTVPYDKRTRIELRLVELWHRGIFARKILAEAIADFSPCLPPEGTLSTRLNAMNGFTKSKRRRVHDRVRRYFFFMTGLLIRFLWRRNEPPRPIANPGLKIGKI